MTSKISYAQAVALARKLHKEGVCTPSILAEKLAEAGYVSAYTGRPLTPMGAYNMAIRGVLRRRRHYNKSAATAPAAVRPALTARKSAATTPGAVRPDRLQLVKRILETRSMPAEDRCALALLAL